MITDKVRAGTIWSARRYFMCGNHRSYRRKLVTEEIRRRLEFEAR